MDCTPASRSATFGATCKVTPPTNALPAEWQEELETNRLALNQSEQARRDLERELIAVRESEFSYRAVIDNQTDLICRYKADGLALTFANPAFCEFFDCQPDEVIGKSFLEVLPEKDRGAWETHIATVVQHHERTTHEHPTQRADGIIAWHQWTELPLIDPRGDGPTPIIQARAVDITQQKNQEATLRRSATLFWSITEMATKPAESLESKLDRILEQCSRQLHLEIGLVARISGNDYEVLFARSPDNSIRPHQVFSLKDTYCEKTFGELQTVGFHHAGAGGTLEKPPCLSTVQTRKLPRLSHLYRWQTLRHPEFLQSYSPRHSVH